MFQLFSNVIYLCKKRHQMKDRIFTHITTLSIGAYIFNLKVKITSATSSDTHPVLQSVPLFYPQIGYF